MSFECTYAELESMDVFINDLAVLMHEDDKIAANMQNTLETERIAEFYQNELFAESYQRACTMIYNRRVDLTDFKHAIIDTYLFGPMRKHLIVVIDTNSWYTNEDKNALHDMFFMKGVEVFVPGVVLKEMDRIKQRDPGQANHMREILNIIYESAVNGSIVTVGGIIAENEYKKNVPNTTNDDVICWYIGKFIKSDNRLVCFITRDTNLKLLCMSYSDSSKLVFFNSILDFVKTMNRINSF